MMVEVRNTFNKLQTKQFGMHDSRAQLSGPGARSDDIMLNNLFLVYFLSVIYIIQLLRCSTMP